MTINHFSIDINMSIPVLVRIGEQFLNSSSTTSDNKVAYRLEKRTHSVTQESYQPMLRVTLLGGFALGRILTAL